jgi:hypothetical protein
MCAYISQIICMWVYANTYACVLIHAECASMRMQWVDEGQGNGGNLRRGQKRKMRDPLPCRPHQSTHVQEVLRVYVCMCVREHVFLWMCKGFHVCVGVNACTRTYAFVCVLWKYLSSGVTCAYVDLHFFCIFDFHAYSCAHECENDVCTANKLIGRLVEENGLLSCLYSGDNVSVWA